MPAAHPLVVEGRVWVFGDSVNTDEMYPGFALKLRPAEAARHVFSATRPGWVDEVQPGDIIVGGRSFGLGSARPVAPLLLELGIACVLAEEFSSLFLRNCVNYGLPAINVPRVTAGFEDGQLAVVDLEKALVRNASSGAVLLGTAHPPLVLDLIKAGGIANRLEREGFIPDAAALR